MDFELRQRGRAAIDFLADLGAWAGSKAPAINSELATRGLARLPNLVIRGIEDTTQAAANIAQHATVAAGPAKAVARSSGLDSF